LNDKLVFADNGEFFTGVPYLISIVQPMEATLFDYAEAAVLILDEPEVLRETYEKFFSALEQRFQQTANAGGVALPPREIFLSPEDFLVRASAARRVAIEDLCACGSSFIGMVGAQ